MTSVTSQKSNLRGIIHEEVMRRYQAMKKQAREELFLTLITRYSGTMTLRQLDKWHFSLYPPGDEYPRTAFYARRKRVSSVATEEKP